jgi:Polyketide cyclase / dehydrase and lipid transport
MASIHKEIEINAEPARVWAAIRDVGAVHRRLAPGYVVDVRLEEDVRIVSFGDGRVIREIIVGIDDTACRLAYAAVGVAERKHHNASLQVFPMGDDASRVVWITDILPDETAGQIAANMEKGLAAVKTHLERAD